MQYKVRIVDLTEVVYNAVVDADNPRDAKIRALSDGRLWKLRDTVKHEPCAIAFPFSDKVDAENGNIILDILSTKGWKETGDPVVFQCRKLEKMTPSGRAQVNYQYAEEYGGHQIVFRWYPADSGSAWSTLLFGQHRWDNALADEIEKAATATDNDFYTTVWG